MKHLDTTVMTGLKQPTRELAIFLHSRNRILHKKSAAYSNKLNKNYEFKYWVAALSVSAPHTLCCIRQPKTRPPHHLQFTIFWDLSAYLCNLINFL